MPTKLQPLQKQLCDLLKDKCQAMGSTFDELVCTAKDLDPLEREALERIQFDLEHLKRGLSVPDCGQTPPAVHLAQLVIKILQLRRNAKQRDLHFASTAVGTAAVAASVASSKTWEDDPSDEDFGHWNPISPFHDQARNLDRIGAGEHLDHDDPFEDSHGTFNDMHDLFEDSHSPSDDGHEPFDNSDDPFDIPPDPFDDFDFDRHDH